MTGPIRVEGAEPGDLLVVDVLEVVPSMAGDFLTAAALDVPQCIAVVDDATGGLEPGHDLKLGLVTEGR